MLLNLKHIPKRRPAVSPSLHSNRQPAVARNRAGLRVEWFGIEASKSAGRKRDYDDGHKQQEYLFHQSAIKVFKLQNYPITKLPNAPLVRPLHFVLHAVCQLLNLLRLLDHVER